MNVAIDGYIMSNHPYKNRPDRAFWSRAFKSGTSLDFIDRATGNLIPNKQSRVVSAGSCFAANLVSILDGSGFTYLRTERFTDRLGIPPESFGYDTFSAAYGNVYTSRQLLQLLRRATGFFTPEEDRWHEADRVVDPFRPGLRYPARCDSEFDVLTRQHLARTREALTRADVFIFTLGLTEAWVARDGAVFPACPGTIAGLYDADRHSYINFSCRQVADDLSMFIEELRRINADVRVILTVSPVPLVATAETAHVAVASTYSKSILRVAAGEVANIHDNVFYFPSYEIVTGPQAPCGYFADDRRSVSPAGIQAVMAAFLAACGQEGVEVAPSRSTPDPGDLRTHFSGRIVEIECEEAALDK